LLSAEPARSAGDFRRRRRDDPDGNSIEIDRSREDVFAYVTDPTRSPGWQETVVRASRQGRFDALGDARTRFTFELDFEGHGIGKLLVPLFVRRQAAKELPESHANLKRKLESAGDS
jgi:hypothetical protein